MKTRFTSALVAICFMLNVAPSFASNGAANGPTTRTTKVFHQVVKTENVRILSLELAPGEFLDYHSNPEQEAYAASDGTLKMVTPDGSVKEVSVKTGDRLWMDLTHFKNWNTGDKTFKIVVLEPSVAKN
ncbi:hypothetical protein [Rufibacter roseus]|uniref:Cupin domain-containing protein n=1 Tax=Rufibacter roseus TaxID=1567108 RepID=A0ABW2DNG1_9BACT|nr:hypothetical protein [Rufibacter roseus]